MFSLKDKCRRGKVLALDHYNWFDFDFGKVRAGLEAAEFGYHRIDVAEARKAPPYGEIPPEFIAEACLYSVCNELESSPADIDRSNPRHADVLQKWEASARSSAGHIARLIRDRKITCFLFPQGYVLEAALCRWFAAQGKLPVLAIENTLSKERLLWENLSGITVNANLAKNYYWKFNSLVQADTAAAYARQYLDGIVAVKSAEHASPQSEGVEVDGSRKVVLFLGQVYVDSSVIFGLRGFAGQERLIEHLCRYCLERGHVLVVKLHPKEIAGKSLAGRPFDKLTWRKLCARESFRASFSDHPDIIVDHENRYDTYRLIERADACVTINSMAGLEACLAGRPVVTCGQASYDGLGFTAEAWSAAALDFHLHASLQSDRFQNLKALSAAQKFFFIYMNLYCVPKSEPEVVRLMAGHHV